MELRYYFDILRRRSAFVGLVVIVALLAAWLITPRQPDYLAESTIYVGFSNFGGLEGDDSDVSVERFATVDRILITFSEMVMSRTVAEPAIAELGLDRTAEQVVNQTTAAPIGFTQLMRVQVRDPDPVVARDLANGLATAFTDRIRAFEGGAEETLDTGDLPSGLPAYVYELATVPRSPIPNNLIRNLLLGFAFGLLVAVGVVFLLEYLDLTVKGAEDAERRIELPVLGVIPRFDKPYSPFLAPARHAEPRVGSASA